MKNIPKFQGAVIHLNPTPSIDRIPPVRAVILPSDTKGIKSDEVRISFTTTSETIVLKSDAIGKLSDRLRDARLNKKDARSYLYEIRPTLIQEFPTLLKELFTSIVNPNQPDQAAQPSYTMKRVSSRKKGHWQALLEGHRQLFDLLLNHGKQQHLDLIKTDALEKHYGLEIPYGEPGHSIEVTQKDLLNEPDLATHPVTIQYHQGIQTLAELTQKWLRDLEESHTEDRK